MRALLRDAEDQTLIALEAEYHHAHDEHGSDHVHYCPTR